MKLAICTDVFADLSYTDMLDKVKSLGIDAVEMTAGGWGARKHCNTAELLADEGKRKEFMGELEKRGMRISALNTSCNPLWPSKTGEEYKKSMYDCATLAGRKEDRSHGWSAGRQRDRHDSELDHLYRFLAGLYGTGLRVPVEGNHRVLE